MGKKAEDTVVPYFFYSKGIEKLCISDVSGIALILMHIERISSSLCTVSLCLSPVPFLSFFVFSFWLVLLVCHATVLTFFLDGPKDPFFYA